MSEQSELDATGDEPRPPDALVRFADRLGVEVAVVAWVLMVALVVLTTVVIVTLILGPSSHMCPCGAVNVQW